jgi:hypothetical protein
VKVGLCATCANARVVENRRGSRFYLCTVSERDPRYPKYPPLPVLACEAYTPGAEPLPEPADDDGYSE